MQRLVSTMLSLLLGFGLWIAVPAPALGHEDAVLEADRSVATAGDRVILAGREFAAGGKYGLRLVGALDEHDLGSARADSAGRFRIEVSVPSETRPGRYRLVAVAADGDLVARAEIQVVTEIEKRATPAGGVDADHGGGGAARADELHLERSRSFTELGLIVVILGSAAGLGFSLLRLGAAA
jgi:hypothetical protein